MKFTKWHPIRKTTAALAMTLVNPFILWDVGFQLSFVATLGLMLYVGPWSQWTQNNLRRFADPETASRLTRSISEVILATMAAMLLTLPLILYHFERLSLISPIANLFILPAQPGVMIWGGLATLTRTWQCYATWPSISLSKRKQPKAVSRPNDCRQPGMRTIWLRS